MHQTVVQPLRNGKGEERGKMVSSCTRGGGAAAAPPSASPTRSRHCARCGEASWSRLASALRKTLRATRTCGRATSCSRSHRTTPGSPSELCPSSLHERAKPAAAASSCTVKVVCSTSSARLPSSGSSPSWGCHFICLQRVRSGKSVRSCTVASTRKDEVRYSGSASASLPRVRTSKKEYVASVVAASAGRSCKMSRRCSCGSLATLAAANAEASARKRASLDAFRGCNGRRAVTMSTGSPCLATAHRSAQGACALKAAVGC
eukprot:scaffold125911_cov63-Phaeocystis_antarctica.AAC.3